MAVDEEGFGGGSGVGRVEYGRLARGGVRAGEMWKRRVSGLRRGGVHPRRRSGAAEGWRNGAVKGRRVSGRSRRAAAIGKGE